MTTVPHSDDIDPPPEEFEPFYRATGERTFRIACRMARGDRHVARDATQDAYEQLLRIWDSRRHRPVADNTRYVAGIAVRKVADAYRARPHTVALADEHEAPEHEAGYDEVLGRPLLDAARELIDRQPTRRRAVAILYFLEECGYAEVAGILGIAESTVRTHVERMRVLMKPLVDRGGRA